MNRISVIYLILIVVISVGIQIFAATQQSFWEDEAFTSVFASRGPEQIAEVSQWDVHPPLYLYMAAYWGKIFGYDEFGLRFLSILFSEFTLFLTFLFTKNLLGNRTAFAAVTILAFSPLFIMFGHYARYYALAAFLAVSVAYSSWLFATSRNFLPLLFYVISSILFVYVLFAAVVVIAVSFVWWFVVWWQSGRRSALDVLIWILAQLAILAAYIPGLNLLSNLLGRSSEIVQVSNWLVEFLKRSLYIDYVFGLGETISPINPIAWIGGVILLIIAIVSLYRLRRNVMFWFPVLIALAIVLVGIAMTVNAQVSITWQNLPARAFYALPFLSIWLGAGLAGLEPRYLRVAGLCILLTYAYGNFNYLTGREYLRPVFAVPWRGIFAEIQQQAKPDALVVCGEGDTTCNYYSRLFGFEGYGYTNWTNLSSTKHSEVWWVQNNLSRPKSSEVEETTILDQLAKEYQSVTIKGYGEQDQGIRRIKEQFLGGGGYEFRTVVYRFYNP
jgi:uncharacterized membrane protein